MKKETPFVLRGTGEREPGRKGDEMCTGGGSTGVRKREIEGGKLCKIAQYFEIKNSAKRLEPTKIRWELGLKCTGSVPLSPSFCSL